MSLDAALELTRTGDIWVFRGRSGADRAIQLTTNSPVNHVGMAVVLEDLPPLMWHAELGRSLPDMWSGTHQRGVQLHDLRDAVCVWGNRYGQRAWLRQLDPPATRDMENAALRTDRAAGRHAVPLHGPALLALGARPGAAGAPAPAPADRAPEAAAESADDAAARLETAYCAEVVAVTYEEMGLLPAGRRPNWYDPGRFWSGDDLRLAGPARLGAEIAVAIPPR